MHRCGKRLRHTFEIDRNKIKEQTPITSVFVSYAKEDNACAEAILQGLEAQGYSIWREPASLTMESVLYPRTIENEILASAAVVLLWSSSAASSDWVERHRLFAQRLKKPLVPILLDGTALPNTLIVDKTFSSQAPCSDVVAQLLPVLPQPDSKEPLLVLGEKAAHEFISTRKEAIELAAEMLGRNEHREEVLAILEYLASNDLMTGVRDKAQGVIDADVQKAPPAPSWRFGSDESRHIFGVRCKNGHVTYFNKQRVCPASGSVARETMDRAGKKLDILYLQCEQCGEEMVVHVDCEGYKKEHKK